MPSLYKVWWNPRMRSSCAAGLLLLASAALPARASSRAAIARETNSPSGAIVVEDDLTCMQCSTVWHVIGMSGGIIYLRLEHALDGDCGAAAASVPTGAHGAALPVRLVSLAEGEGDEGNCSRCGGTSSCHSDYQEGGCHIACGPAGGEQVRYEEEARAMQLFRASKTDSLVEHVRSSKSLAFNRERGLLQSLGCGRKIVSQIALDRNTALILEAKLSEMAGDPSR